MISPGRSLLAALALLLVLPAVAAASAPTHELGPLIWGPAVDGEQIESLAGVWDGGGEPTTYPYQWLRCAPAGDSCVAIDGADQWDHIATVADIGSTLRLEETATNASGSVSARSPWPLG